MNFFKVMSLLILLNLGAASAASDNGKAFDDKSCRDVYNSSFENLRNHVNDFNNGSIGKGSFATSIVGLDTYVTSKRAICYVIESPLNKKCVDIYKKRYKALRDNIKITSVLLGNQTEVSEDLLETIRNEFGTLYMRLRCGDLE
jgi:hypothetical protein